MLSGSHTFDDLPSKLILFFSNAYTFSRFEMFLCSKLLLVALVQTVRIQGVLAIRTHIAKVRTMVAVATETPKDATIRVVTKTRTVLDRLIPFHRVCLLVLYLVILMFHVHTLIASLL